MLSFLIIQTQTANTEYLQLAMTCNSKCIQPVLRVLLRAVRTEAGPRATASRAGRPDAALFSPMQRGKVERGYEHHQAAFSQTSVLLAVS